MNDHPPLSDRPTLGLLGLGAFGRLAATHLAPHTDLVAHDPDVQEAAVPLKRAASCEVVVLAMPVPALADCLRAIAPHVRPGALVCDVCSVKLEPTRQMRELLPEHARLLGTHPLFGPQTAEELGTIRGQRLALCPERIDAASLERVRALLTDTLGLRTIVTDADEHDRQMALVQVITHLVGHAAADMELPDSPLATVAYERLMQMKRNTQADAPELFAAIQTLNPHAADARARFFESMQRVIRRAERS